MPIHKSVRFNWWDTLKKRKESTLQQASSIHAASYLPYAGYPLGTNIILHEYYGRVRVELPRVIHHKHNAALISVEQAQIALELHMSALQAQFPWISFDRFEMREVDAVLPDLRHRPRSHHNPDSTITTHRSLPRPA